MTDKGAITQAIEALEDIMERNEIQHWFNTDKQAAALKVLKAFKDGIETLPITDETVDEWIKNLLTKPGSFTTYINNDVLLKSFKTIRHLQEGIK